jgi:hypothetical protein
MNSRRLSSVLGVFLVAALAGCGGGGGSTGGTAPPSSVTSVTASCTPATVIAGQTSQCSATVQGTGNFNSAVTWSVQGSGNGSINSSGLYSAPATVAASTKVTVTATSAGDPTKTGSAAVTVAPPLTVSIQGAVPLMVLGGSQTMTATSNSSGTTFKWTVTCLPASSFSSVTGSVSTLNVPTAVPACFNPVVTLAGTLGTATAKDTAAITLSYPVPTATIPNIWLLRESIINLPVICTGCYPNGTYQIDNGPVTQLPPGTTFTGFSILLPFGSKNFSPFLHAITISSPSDGHGGGSVTVNQAFLGGQNMAGCSSVMKECFHLDQSTGLMSVFDFTGIHLRDFSVGGLDTAMTVDDQTGNVFVISPFGSVAEYTDTGGINLFDPIEQAPPPRADVSVQNNIVCAVSDQANLLSWYDASQSATTNPVMVSTTANLSTPIAVASTTTGNNQPACLALNVETGTLAGTLAGQSASQVQTVGLPGFTAIQNIKDATGQPNAILGGWALKVLKAANGNSLAMVVSRYNKNAWIVDVHDLSNMQVSGPFTLNGDPLHLAVDDAQNGIISLTDAASRLTRFAKIDLIGNVSPLNSVSPLGVVGQGIVIPPGSGKILVCQGGQCSEVPNN